MALPQTIYSKATKGAANLIVNQTKETLKTIEQQVGLPSSPENTNEKPPGIVERLQDEGVSTLDREEILAQEKTMLAKLESRLSELRAKRQQELTSYTDSVQTTMDKPNEQTIEAPIEPQGKVNKAVGRVTKAVRSILNRKQSETKQGSGKG